MSQLPPLPPVIRLSLISKNPDYQVPGIDYERKKVDATRGDRSGTTQRANLCLVGGASSVTIYDLIRDLRESHRVIALQGDTTRGRTGRDEVKFRTTVVWLENGTEDANPSPQDSGAIEEMMSKVEAFFFPSGKGTQMVVFDGVYVYLNDGTVTVNMVRRAGPPVMGEPVFHLCFRPSDLRRPFPLYLDEKEAYSTRVTDRVARLASYLWEQVGAQFYRLLKAGEEVDLGSTEPRLTSVAMACSDKQFQSRAVTQEEAARAASFINLEAVLRNQQARWDAAARQRPPATAE